MASPDRSVSEHPVAGMLYCATALLMFAIQDAIVKSLSGSYPVMQVLTLRTAVVVVVLTVTGLAFYGHRILLTSAPRLMLIRGVLAFFAFSSYYLSLSRIPLADAAAVYMTAPLFVTILSIPLLGEKVGIHRWVAIAMGFIAVIVILNPGSGLFQFAAALPLFSALCYAMIPIINRRIGFSQHVLTMSIYTTVSYLVLTIIAAILIHVAPAPNSNSPIIAQMLLDRWHLPSVADFGWTAMSGIIFVTGLLCITHAYRIAAVSLVAPAEYSYLIWTSLLGYLIFNDVPGPRVIMGSLVVVAAGLYVMYREQQNRQKQSVST